MASPKFLEVFANMSFHSQRKFLEKSLILVAVLTMHFAVSSAAPPTDADCTSDVPFADTESCTSYYQCFDVNSAWTLVHLDCPTGGYWDDINKACVAGPCPIPSTTELPTTTAVDVSTLLTSIATTAPPGATTSSDIASSSPGASSNPSSDSIPPSSTPPTGSSSESLAPSTPGGVTPGPPTFVCTSSGFFAHPTDPTKYYQCVLIGAQFYYYIYSCPPSACFQQSAGTCVVGACVPSNTTVAPPNGTTPVATSPAPPVTITCDTQGQYVFPGSCTKYYNCVLLSDGFVYYVFECPPGSYFNSATSLCTIGQCPTTSATTPTTPKATGTTTLPATMTTPTPDYPCPNEGYFVDPADCKSYYRCVIISGQMYRYMFHCQVGAYWDSTLKGCIIGTCPAK